MTFGELARMLTERSGLSERDLCGRAGLSATAIATQRARGGWPPVATLERYARVAGVVVTLEIGEDGVAADVRAAG